MRDTMELATRRRADLAAEMTRLDAFISMARQLEEDASAFAVEAQRAAAVPVSEDAAPTPSTDETAVNPMAGWRPARRESAEEATETAAGRTLVQGFRPRHMPEVAPVKIPPKREETPNEPASVENMFAAC